MGQRLTKRDIRLLQEDRRINAINFINNIVKEKDELQSRIDKVIEYVKRYEQINGYYDSCYDGEYDTYLHDNVKEELLDILKGSDTNE